MFPIYEIQGHMFSENNERVSDLMQREREGEKIILFDETLDQIQSFKQRQSFVTANRENTKSFLKCK